MVAGDTLEGTSATTPVQSKMMAVVEVKGAIGVERLRDFPLIENRVI